jgi:hypothetical protein
MASDQRVADPAIEEMASEEAGICKRASRRAAGQRGEELPA